MPIFIAAIGGMLLNLVGTLAGRVLIGLGISVITYTGMSASLDALKTQAIGSFSALPPGIFAILGILKIGQCINIVMSATAARMVINGLGGDTMKKWVNK